MGITQSQGGRRATASGYTRSVGWKQRISVVVLIGLAAVPVSRALCALACSSPAETASAHHGSRIAQKCDEPARSSTGLRIESGSQHDCSEHGAALHQLTTAAAERITLRVTDALSAAPTRDTTFNSVLTKAPVFEYTSPPGLAPPTVPLVLRV